MNRALSGPLVIVDSDPFASLAEKFCPADWCKAPVGDRYPHLLGAVCNKQKGHKSRHDIVRNDHPEAGSWS